MKWENVSFEELLKRYRHEVKERETYVFQNLKAVGDTNLTEVTRMVLVEIDSVVM